MENGSAKKERHKRADQMESHLRFESHDSQGGREEEGVRKKKKKKKHRDSSQNTASQEIDGVSVDLDAPQRYIPTPEHKRKATEVDSNFENAPPPSAQPIEQEQTISANQSHGNGSEPGSPHGARAKEQHKRSSLRILERSVFEGVAAMIDAETLDLQLAKRKAEEKKPTQSKKKEKHNALKSKEQPHNPIEDAELARDTDYHRLVEQEAKRRKEAKRRRREEKRARKSSEALKPTTSEDNAQETVKEEDSIAETPHKKRKRAIEGSSEHREASKVEEKPGYGDQQTPKSTPTKKRKLDHSAQSTPLLLNTIPVHGKKSFLTTITNASPHTHVEDTAVETTPTPGSKNTRKLSQESPPRLHTISAQGSPTTPNRVNLDEDDNKADRSSEKKKKRKKPKRLKESVGTTFLISSRLLTPNAKTRSDLLQSVLKGTGSHNSSSISTPDKTSKVTPSIDTSSTEDETEERSRAGTPTPSRRPLFRPILPPSPAPILPKKQVVEVVRKETPIPPPKRLVASQSPAILPKLVRPNKIKAELMADSDDDGIEKATKKRKLSKSIKSKAAAEEESFSQAIASIKKTTDSRIHDLFSDGESEREEKDDPFAQAFDSIRKSASKLANIFNKPEVPSTEKKGEKTGASAKVVRARSVSASMVQPLAFNEDGLNTASEDWESTIGRVRSTAGGGDDSEAQESRFSQSFLRFPLTDNHQSDIAFSASYIASRSAGIKISNTTFQVHNLRHNEGWVVSSAEREIGSDGKDFKLKICTIISGRVQVRLGKNGFGVGKGSVFRVRSGEECVVRNGEKKMAVVWVVCVE